MLAARAGVLSSVGPDVLRQRLEEPRSTGFAAQPAHRRAGALYGAALAASLLRDAPAAQRALEQLQATTHGDAAAERQLRWLRADMALRAGQAQAALLAMQEEGRTRPDLLLRAQAQIRAGQAAAASTALQTWVVQHPQDASAWQWLASAWQAQGQPLRAVRAEAEAHAARHDYVAAVDRFKAGQDIARKSASAPDYIEASIIDTRLRAVALLLREQTAER